MGWRIALSEQAEDDLERAVAWIALLNSRAAERIGLELVAVIFSLDQFPQRGSPVRLRAGLRKVSHRHYLVYYRVNETAQRVEVVRIWDGRRNPVTLHL